MLIGNPGVFAIWCDAVGSWSTDCFKNGCFAYFIDGRLLLSLASTLGVDLNLLSALACIEGDAEDNRLFHLPCAEAYAELCARAFPSMDSSAEFSDYKHLVSVGSLLDEGHHVFLIKSGDQAKLIRGFKDDLSSVCESTLKLGEFQSVVLEAIDKSSNKEH
ncbi:hypothetical protein GCM10027093_62630 [Paraburkholderia jirisanensis]